MRRVACSIHRPPVHPKGVRRLRFQGGRRTMGISLPPNVRDECVPHCCTHCPWQHFTGSRRAVATVPASLAMRLYLASWCTWCRNGPRAQLALTPPLHSEQQRLPTLSSAQTADTMLRTRRPTSRMGLRCLEVVDILLRPPRLHLQSFMLVENVLVVRATTAYRNGCSVHADGSTPRQCCVGSLPKPKAWHNLNLGGRPISRQVVCENWC